MKNVKDKDERVIAQRRKIQSDGFQLLIYALLLSVVVQQIFLHSSPNQYMAELLCLIGAGFYSLIRNLNLGNNVFGDDSDSNKSIFKKALLYGLGSVVFAALLTGEKNIGYLLSYFLTFTIVFCGMNYLFHYISKKSKIKLK
ncbi:MAG: DUF6773 family protein [Paeniclostridium sordellii]|nr:DUF6773 family protein [Paeniclostridium sordellii]